MSLSIRHRGGRGLRRASSMAALMALTALSAPVAAAPVRIFDIQGASGFLPGTFAGVALDRSGVLALGQRFAKVGAIDAAFVFAAVALPDGWAVGTGNPGKILKMSRDGKVTELFAAPEQAIFALYAEKDGTVFAGSSPNGKVYRLAPGKPAEVWFEPKETYVWALARAADGALLVATGTQGKLFRVTARGQGELLFDDDDAHLRSLLVTRNGDVVIGTSGRGRVLRRDGKSGSVRSLFDAAEPEIVALAEGLDGSIFAAAVSTEPPLSDLAAAAAARPGGSAPGAAKSEEPKPVVTVTLEGEAPPPSTAQRAPGAGARSEVVRVAPSGAFESVWQSSDEVAYSLLAAGSRLWIATGPAGKLYGVEGDRTALERDFEERQLVAVVADAGSAEGLVVATSSGAAIYRAAGGAESSGEFTGPPLDAGALARFGTFRWNADLPAGAKLAFAFRSGSSSDPDQTWSVWSDARTGEEIPLSDLPPARFVQWRAAFTAAAGGGSPRLGSIQISYRQLNLRPRIDRLEVLAPGQVLVPIGFNPADQVFEPAAPNKDGIFTTLGPPVTHDDAGRLKQVWKKGYRTLHWQAGDPNQDELVYALSVRADGGDGRWLSVVADLKDDFFSFDSTSLPDGRYRFRLEASDRSANEEREALATSEETESVVVDNSAPVVVSVGRAGKSILVEARDAWNPIREAVWSLDAASWKPATPADGILDGRSEKLELPAPPDGAHTLLLRLTDAAFNVATFDLVQLLKEGKR